MEPALGFFCFGEIQQIKKSSNTKKGTNMAFQPQGNFGNRDRQMYKATCAECKKECEVPFKPSGDRPVYCKDCFSKRKDGGR